MIVVFSGYNQRSIIAFLRTIEEHNLDYAIIAKSEEDDIFLTKYKSNVVAIREKTELDFDDIKNCLSKIKTNSKLFIAPSTEALNRYLLENKEKFENLNCIIPIVEKTLYKTISDKLSFSRLCEENGIDIPQNVEFSQHNIPFVAKPISYSNSKNEILSPELILCKEDFDNFKKGTSDDFYFQEFIEGQSFYLLYYFSKNGDVVKFSQQNLLQQPNGKSIVAAIPADIHNKKISSEFENLFKKIKFFGLVMVEVRKNNDKYTMIEANPRFWGPSQLFIDCGINFFEYFLKDNGFDIKIKNEAKNGKYFFNGGYDTDVCYLCEAKDKFNYKEFFDCEIYNRQDSHKIFEKETREKLIKNYSKNSKHSNYQILTKSLRNIVNSKNLVIKSRSEKERLDYILKNIDVKNCSVIDIGANTGYFTFELLDNGAQKAKCFEGNKSHAMFILQSANLLDYTKKINVIDEYFNFSKEGETFDVMLLLNVLHHIGDDYGDKSQNIKNTKTEILKEINNMAFRTKLLAFQLGFNWKGDKNHCLFENGTKKELIDYIKNGTSEFWEIQKIGIAQKIEGKIVYNDLDNINIKRDDSLGEFLNRPLFIMKSKNSKTLN